jgi:hypothetical protein
MNIFSFLSDYLKGRLKIQPHQLKGAPGVKTDADAEQAAAAANALIGAKVDEIAAEHGHTPAP